MKNKAIIYDNNCPMCALYTQGFVNWHILEKENRISFSQLTNQASINQVDWQRAKHEIPLVDLQGGQTLYGLNALVFLLSSRMPWLRSVLHCKPLYNLCSFLYNLVSYNRRFIVPATTSTRTGFDCTPGFHVTYRAAFIVLAILSSMGITYAFGQSLNPLLASTTGGLDMLLIAGTGWVVHVCLGAICLRTKRIDYMSHLSVLMLIGVLVLLPAICLNSLTRDACLPVSLLSVLLSSSLMCHQHWVRVRAMGLPQSWTLIWFLVLQSTAAFWIFQLYFN